MFAFKKYKKIFIHSLKWYKKKKKKLDPKIQKEFESSLNNLALYLQKKNIEKTKEYAEKVNLLYKNHLKISPIEKFLHSTFSFICAIIIALLVRQIWFENYTIPTGSMRPTLQEKDFLVVSKTAFGINAPTRKSHIYFKDSLIKRGDVAIFTVADMDVRDSDHLYFFFIPGKKQYVKRLIAKPGDTIYFSEGKIYGMDENENFIEEFQKDPWFSQLPHIPFINLEGKKIYPNQTSFLPENTLFLQMNTPIAKISLGKYGKLLFNKNPPFAKNFSPEHYFDIWGIKNYAKARILSEKMVKNFYPSYKLKKDIQYYLEITHHPNLKKINIQKTPYQITPCLDVKKSLIPLQSKHINSLFNHLTTCRFTVKNNTAKRISSSHLEANFFPSFIIPNGTYEFFNGKAYKINILGIRKQLKKDHPIYQKSLKDMVKFFNLGIEMNTLFLPQKKDQFFTPSRYAFYKDGDLYLMGQKIFSKEDPILQEFIKSEIQKTDYNYYPFIYEKENIDKNFLNKYGLKIPKNHYLVLGDNYAMSADSRDFGFVPRENLRGRPLFIFWPIGNRLGKIFQPNHNFFSIPSIIIWIIAAIIGILVYRYIKKKRSYPLKF